MRKNTRRQSLRLTVLFGAALMPLAGAASEEEVARLAERCQSCHMGGLALDRFDTATLIERIGKVQNVPGQHAPLLSDADEELIAALAERLAGGAGD